MDEHPESALHYGHVGRAIYLPETQTWTFSRSFARNIPISYTGVTKTTVPASTPVSQTQNSSKPVRTADPQLIPHVLPELASQWSSLQDDAFSKVVLTATNICDPQVSSLIDLGYATYHGAEDTRGRVPVAIAASVTGECGNTISFRVLTDETAELPLDGSALRAMHWPDRGHRMVQAGSPHSAHLLCAAAGRKECLDGCSPARGDHHIPAPIPSRLGAYVHPR
jgi:RNA polymerase I-specific transcription initiation factor RRN6